MALNTATSVVDFLQSQKKPSDFNSRKGLYDSLGLTGAFGDYRGTSEQNTTLLKKLSAPSQPQQEQQEKLDPYEQARRSGTPYVPEEKTPKDVIADTTPSTVQTVYDLAKSDEEKAAEAEIAESSMALAGQTARASESLQRDVNTLNRTAAEGVFDLAQAGTKKKARIGEQAAGFGGATSGATQASQAEVAKEVAMKQDRVKAKLGDSLYNTFSDFEKNYGTEFLSKLSIPEAESFSKLPVAVRGIVMQNYQDAIAKAQATASKNALSTLEKLGYTVVGGQIVQTLSGRTADRADESAVRAEESAVRADKRLELAEAASARAEEASLRAERKSNEPDKKTQTEREREEFGGFTQDQANKGASVAGVPITDFKAFDEQSKNYFVNNAEAIEKYKESIQKNKTGKKLAEEDKALEARTDLPQEVRNVLRRNVRSKLTDDKMKKEFQKQGRVL